jgi:DNA-binding NtrC family response regulator
MWKSVEKDVEHEYLRSLASDVAREVNELNKDFVLEATPTLDLKYRDHQKALRRFLLDQADQRGKRTKEEVAETLGISRQTLFEWERELRTR